MDPRPRLVDVYMPTYHVRTRHEIRVRAPAPVTYAALRSTDLFAPRLVRILFALRVLPARIGRPRPRATARTLADLERGGALLDARPGREIAFGVIGRFWALRQRSHRPVSRETFTAFAEPDFAKAVMAFSVDPIDAENTLLGTETRVICTDRAGRLRFGIYWTVIGPFSSLLRTVWLAAVRDTAERAVRGERTIDPTAIPSPRVTAAEGQGRRGTG